MRGSIASLAGCSTLCRDQSLVQQRGCSSAAPSNLKRWLNLFFDRFASYKFPFRYCEEMLGSLTTKPERQERLPGAVPRGATVFHSVRQLRRTLVAGLSTVTLAAAGFAAIAIQPAPA